MTTVSLQGLIVAAVVAGCLLYAAWTLMPAALRRRLAALLLGAAPWPAALAARLKRAARAPSGCGCDGCDAPSAAPGPAAGKEQNSARPLTFHPRPKRR